MGAGLRAVIQILGQDQYTEDLEKYLLHYVAQLFLNFAKTQDETSTHSCSNFFSTYVSGISDLRIAKICGEDKQCASDAPFIQHCFIEFVHYPSVYDCNCNFTELLGTLEPEPLTSRVLSPFEQHIHFMVMTNYTDLLDCRYYNGTCPLLVVGLN